MKTILLALIGALVPTLCAAQNNTSSPMVHPNLYYWKPPSAVKPQTIKTQVCIYGGNSGGVMAAVQLRRLGRSVILLEPGGHLGGLSTGGLSYTDFGNKAAIGGLAREFYRRVGAKYGVNEEWNFEPHIAERVMLDLVTENQVPVYYRQFVAKVQMRGKRLTALTTENGLTVQADQFIDCTYEGDLMARAGVSYHVGREGNSVYGETLNGVQVRGTHQFDFPVDPYVKEGDPSSGLLPGIDPAPLEAPGTGDKRVQTYNFRMCLTRRTENRIPFPKPPGYDPREYMLLARYLATGWNEVFRKFDPIRNDKTDTNNHGAVSTDFIGRNHTWPEADYATRERLFQAHVTYQMGLMWFLANDERVPEPIRTKMAGYGLAKDEFPETGGWPHQLYIREGRRMVSDYVMTELNCRGQKVAERPVGIASYNMDSHNCRRFLQDGKVKNEGDIQVGVKPYPIDYRAIIPKRGECENLFVPVCLSCSHIAYGSIRMEPVFMILGQSAALAADLALQRKCALQDIPYEDLRPRLEQAGQVLEKR